MLSIKFDHPKLTSPLDFLGLGCVIVMFCSIFFLVIDEKIKMFISTLIPRNYTRKSVREKAFYLLRMQVLTFYF